MNAPNPELTELLTKFAQSGWDVLEGPSQAFLSAPESSGPEREALVSALLHARETCGSCGCEFDPLYPRALFLLEQMD